MILAHAYMCRRKQEFRLASLEVLNGVPDVLEREVDEALPAQDDINLRHLIFRRVLQKKFPAFARIQPMVRDDNVRNHVPTYVIDIAKIDVPHPMEVTAARIKQGSCVDAR